MADSRFFAKSGPFNLKEIVALTGAEPVGAINLNALIEDVAPLDRANKNEISFLDNIKYIDVLAMSEAGVCFIRSKNTERAPKNMTLLISEDPYRSFALTAQKFYPNYRVSSTVSSKAHIASNVMLGKNCTIEAGAVIEGKAEIGENCHIGFNAVIHAGVIIGKNSHVGANSTLSHAIVGKNVIIHRGVHIGQDGFGFAMGKGGHIKVPQLGRVIIEDNVEIGSGTCIDRGTGPDTIIGEGSKIDNLVQIGHNVHIGKQSILVSQSGIAGSTRIGDGVILGGQVGIAGHLKIGNGARVAAQGGVMVDIPAGASYGGSPAVPVKDWHRQTIALSRLIKRKDMENE
jgi:UDP-3-O-[3-hydroxymyristoyl] glucosamine N-acyltransferase